MKGTGMRLGGILVATAAGLTTSACTTAPAPRLSDIDFVWGCWAQKDASGGMIEAFLRLVPNQEGGSLSGFVDKILVPGSEVDLSFTRDGSAAYVGVHVSGQNEDSDIAAPQPINNFLRDYRSGPLPDGPANLAIFKSAGSGSEVLIAEGAGESLKISRRSLQGPVETLFEGERDGCD